ncbi:MAG: hypothetical protein IKA99_02675 [Clostridia bacterium]|nr:hypothetical protein [Clostridia bacterium]
MRNLKLNRPRRARIELGKFYNVDHRIDGEVGSYNRAELCYNFSCKDGSLKTSFGLRSVGSKYTLPNYEVIDAIYYFRHNDYENGVNADKIIAYGVSGSMYCVPASGGAYQKIPNLSFTKKPIGVCYNYNSKDVIIFSAEGEGIKIYDGVSVVEVPDAPSVTSMCIHNERLFITSGGVDGALWFSDDFDPTNWNVSLTEAGFIDMSDDRGEMLEAVAFGGHVYVFRSYGVSRVTAYGDQTDFSVSHLLVSCGKICKNTITVCGDCILFFASDGLYRFDGYNAVRISDAWFDNVETTKNWVKGVYYNGYAYYLISVAINTGLQRGIFAIKPDGSDYAFSLIAQITDIAVMNGVDMYKLFAVERLKLNVFEVEQGAGWNGENIHMEWHGKETDFGLKAKSKTLDKVRFFANSPVRLTVVADGVDHVFELKPKNGVCEKYTRLKGEKFAIKLYALGVNVEISAVELEFLYYV